MFIKSSDMVSDRSHSRSLLSFKTRIEAKDHGLGWLHSTCESLVKHPSFCAIILWELHFGMFPTAKVIP